MTVLRAAEPDAQPEVDAALIARSQTDPEQFGEIYDRYATEVHRYLARSRHRYDPTAERALPWLYGIATNLLRRHARTERAQYRRWERTGIDPIVADDHADAVVRAVSAEATVRKLSGALARLTARERDVVLLIVWGGLTYEETAAALEVPVGTVRSRLNRARQRLREALGGSNFDEEMEK